VSKTRFIPVILAIAIVPVSAQTGASSNMPHVQVELMNTVKTKKAKVGDQVKARTASPLILPDGTVVPVASPIAGQIREVQADSGGKSSLAISFDQVEIDGKKRPVTFLIRAAMLAGGSPKPAQNGEAISPSDVHHERPMAGRSQTVQDSAEVQTRAPSTRSTPDAPKTSGPYMAAQTGSVIGMPGVSLQVDEDGQHPSKFLSTSPNLELKQGLQLMLVVPAPAK
jgi:hypothetical protein